MRSRPTIAKNSAEQLARRWAAFKLQCIVSAAFYRANGTAALMRPSVARTKLHE